MHRGYALMWQILGVSSGMFLVGCQPSTTTIHTPHSQATTDATSPPPTPINRIATEAGMAHSKMETPRISTDDDIAKRLEISYARNASYKKNECPKLVEFEALDQTISRVDEQLPSDFCEYFVYLSVGDTLNIRTSRDMQAILISPVWFDFANGSYTAPKFDKYTIRLSYNGVKYHPANFSYDITLIKNGVKTS